MAGVERHWGKDDSAPLIWRAPTLTMNPTFPQSVINAALAEDEPKARAEYFAEFRGDVESFVKIETVKACTGSYVQRAPAGLVYHAFCDSSGGSSDSFTLAIGHIEKRDEVHIDYMVEKRAPFQPSAVVDELAALLKAYNVRAVTGDRYAGDWPRTHMQRACAGSEDKMESKPRPMAQTERKDA